MYSSLQPEKILKNLVQSQIRTVVGSYQVDDVLTTGATLSECGKVLRMTGSGDLVCAVIAATRLETKE